MKEKALLRIAIFGSVFGVILLFFISTQVETKEIDINEIEEADNGESLRFKGVVTAVSDLNETKILTIAQLEKINVVVFNENSRFYKGDYVEIEGKIDEYNGDKNIIADKITLK